MPAPAPPAPRDAPAVLPAPTPTRRLAPAVARAMRAAFDQHDLWPGPGGTAVIACSGGLDSTVLARLAVPMLLAEGSVACLACLDHGWRGEQGREDARFVERLALALGASFATARLPSPPERVQAVGREGAAREVRRGWLLSLLSGPRDRIYLGHQRDDQVETVLLRMGQGAPASMAASMAPRDGPFCRPLLAVPRSGLLALAEEAGWEWREDPSNADVSLARNRLRLVEIPRLVAADAGAVRRLLRAGGQARARIDADLRAAGRARPSVLLPAAPAPPAGHPRHPPGIERVDVSGIPAASCMLPGCVLLRSALAALPDETALALLRSLCQPVGPSASPLPRAPLLALLADCRRGGHARVRPLGSGWTARTSGDVVALSTGPLPLEGTEHAPVPLDEGAAVSWPPTWRLGRARIPAAAALSLLRSRPDRAGRDFALLDLPPAGGSLWVRPAGSGRKMRPFGRPLTRKVRDVLAEAGVPRQDRAGWPVVADAAGTVLWLPGIRAAAAADLAGPVDVILLYTGEAPLPVSAADEPGTP